VLHDYHDIQNCKLRIQIPPNDSCPSTEYDEDIVLYSESFGVQFLDVLAPDILQTYAFSHVKFHQYFVNLPFHISRMCLTTISPEKLVHIIRGKTNLEISSTKGVIMPGCIEEQMVRHFVHSVSHSEHYFSISISQITWFGDQVAIQLSGICPWVNRSQTQINELYKACERTSMLRESPV